MDYIKTLYHYNYQKFLSLQRLFVFSIIWFIGSVLSTFWKYVTEPNVNKLLLINMLFILYLGGMIILFLVILPRYYEYNAASIVCLNALLAKDIRYCETQLTRKEPTRDELTKKVGDALALIRNKGNPTPKELYEDAGDAVNILLLVEPYVKLEEAKSEEIEKKGEFH